MPADYYETLGIARGATPDDVKKAYRGLAKRFHPDVNPGDKPAEERFKQINEAYEILSDPAKRQAYDQFGHAGVGRGGPPPRGGGIRVDDTGFTDLFGDIFDNFFGGTARPRGSPSRGNDLRADVTVSLEEAFRGCERTITLRRPDACAVCKGTGAKGGDAGRRPCPTCHGRGEVRHTQGFFSIVRPCARCGGEGQIVESPCEKCRGTGRVEAERRITVKIPPGVDTGSRIRIPKEGEPGQKTAPPGDLYLIVNVSPHDVFSREDDDLLCEVPLAFVQAALGADVELPTLDGVVKVKVAPGTQSGRVVRVKGKGMPHVDRAGAGDLLIRMQVEVPERLNDRQRDLLREFERAGGAESQPKVADFWSRIRRLVRP